MAKKLYFGVDELARKGKKMYFGVNDRARKAKKAYVGIGGVARPFFGAGEVTYYGTITGMQAARCDPTAASTTVGGYALFAGSGSPPSNSGESTYTVDAYDKNLTRISAPALSSNYAHSATTVGDYAIFHSGGSSYDIYNSSLTHQQLTPTTYCDPDCAGTIGSYAVFWGTQSIQVDMYEWNTVAYANTVSAWLTQSSIEATPNVRQNVSSTLVGDYVLFGGGVNQATSVPYVDAYDTSLVRQTVGSSFKCPTSSMYSTHYGATTVGNYAVFGGSDYPWPTSNLTDAYNKSLTQVTMPSLSTGRGAVSATTLGRFAIFAGGQADTDLSLPETDVYDENLTRTTITGLGSHRSGFLAETIGNYAIIAGGWYESGFKYPYSSVEAYTLV